MKKNYVRTFTMWLLILTFGFVTNTFSQTAGTFTFNVTTTSTGGYSPKHLVAISIENSSAAFIKTKAKYSSASNLDHLAIWTGKSGSSIVDATSGATLNTHGTLTVVWNGTDVNGTLVPDGTYNVWIEMAWASSLTTGKTSTSFAFTKGSSAFHSTPADLANFTSMSLDWTPATTQVHSISVSKINVYPNPVSKFVTLELKSPVSSGVIQILNTVGKEVYSEKVKSGISQKTLDLGKLPEGVYFINVKSDNNILSYRIVKTK